MYFWMIIFFLCFPLNHSSSMTVPIKNLLEEGLIGIETHYLSLDWHLSHHHKLIDWTEGRNLTPIAALGSSLLSVSHLPVRVCKSTVGASNFFSQMKDEGDSLKIAPVLIGHKFLFDPSHFGFEGDVLEFYYLTSLVEGSRVDYLSGNPEILVDIPAPRIRKETRYDIFRRKIRDFHFSFPLPLSYSPLSFLHPASFPKSFFR